MRKVAYIINSINKSGPGQVVINLIKGMKKYKPVLITIFDENDNEVLFELKNCGVEIVSLKERRRIHALLFSLKKIRRIIEEKNIEIVHSHGFIPDLLISLLKEKNVKTVSTIHCNICVDYNYTYGYMGLIIGYIHCIVLKYIKLPIACSEYVFSEMKNYNNHLIYIRNGIVSKQRTKVNVRGRFGLAKNDCIYLYSGKISELKNVVNLVEKFSENHSKDSYLVLIGDGNEIDKCKEKADRNVIFAGYQTNAWDWYEEADIYISASRLEGCSISAIEALANGLPLCLSDIPAHEEFFRIDRDVCLGGLFKSDFSDFKKVMKDMEKNVEEINREKIRDFQKKYLSDRVMANEYQRVYDKLFE